MNFGAVWLRRSSRNILRASHVQRFMEAEMADGYGSWEHEQELIEWERRMEQDEERGLLLQDERHCPRHPHVQTSFRGGMFDGLCGICEAEMDEPSEDDLTPDGWSLGEFEAFQAHVDRLATAEEAKNATTSAPIDDDDIPF